MILKDIQKMEKQFDEMEKNENSLHERLEEMFIDQYEEYRDSFFLYPEKNLK